VALDLEVARAADLDDEGAGRGERHVLHAAGRLGAGAADAGALDGLAHDVDGSAAAEEHDGEGEEEGSTHRRRGGGGQREGTRPPYGSTARKVTPSLPREASAKGCVGACHRGKGRRGGTDLALSARENAEGAA